MAVIVVHVLTHELMKQITTFLLQVLRYLGPTVNDLHEIFVFHVILAVRVNGQQVHGDVIEVLLDEELPLVHGSELGSEFCLLLQLLYEGLLSFLSRSEVFIANTHPVKVE